MLLFFHMNSEKKTWINMGNYSFSKNVIIIWYKHLKEPYFVGLLEFISLQMSL